MVRTVRKGLLLCVVSLLLPGCPEKCVGACGGGGGGSSTGGGGSTGGSGGSTGGGSPTGGGSTGGGTGTGGAGGGDADAGPPPLSLADFCARYPGLACAHLAACGSYDTSSACLASQSIASTCAQVATGTTVFNGVAARDCLDELSASPLSCYSTFSVCGTLVGFGNQAFAPVFLTRSDLCRGAACDAGACDQSCTGPTCQPWRSPGQSCEEDVKPLARCNRATGFCGSRDGGATVCLPVLTAGEDCTTGTCGPSLHCDFLNGTRCAADLADEAPCVYDPFCASGVCRGTDGKCGALDAGASCRNGSDCGRFDSTQICVGLVVRADGGVTPGACAPRPTLGQACDYGWARSTDSCRSGHGCIDGTCRLLTPFSLALGSECPIRPFGRIELPFYGFASCERGLRCLPSTTAHAPRTGRCGPAITAGGACLDEFNCAAGLSCLNQPDGGVACGALPLRGEPCTTSCRFDSVCVNQGDGGRCGPPVPLDGGCAGFLTCEAGATCDGTTCVATGAPGATCAYDFECSSGACQARVCVAMCIR